MSCDLDRRCAAQERELAERIARLDSLLRNRRIGTRWARVREVRDRFVIELHDMREAHAAYDRRRAEAESDPTGQDEDDFYSRYGEGDDNSGRFNEAGEPRW